MQKDINVINFEKIFNLKFVSVNFSRFVDVITDSVRTSRNITIFPVPVNVLVKAKGDTEFFLILDRASFLIPDGVPILWAAKFLGKPLKSKISGSDLFPALCRTAALNKYKTFFLGAKPGVAEKAGKILKMKYPGLEIAGIYSPHFGFEKDEGENQKIVKMIKEKKPDFLFVSLGAPKQEKWISKHKDELGVPELMAVGASFDFLSGNIKRAPEWMQKIGLEWFWRVMMEPRRLWKRYLKEAIIFFHYLLSEKLKKMSG